VRTKPVVVAAHGGTKFGGHELFLACDIRVAASDTVFGQPEVTRGLFPGAGGAIRMSREVGWGNAMFHLLTGEEWGAEEAYRLGLVQAVTPPGKELDRALEIAAKIAAAAPLGVRATLASARQATSNEEAAAFAALPANFGKILQSQDAKEALRAAAEHRAPVFQGI
jgi:enoyl-CoA hydratase